MLLGKVTGLQKRSQPMKWFVTDEISRIHGYGTTDNVLDEVVPNTVISFGGGNPFQTRGWRIRVQDLDAPRGEKTKRVFTTLKAAKAYVEKTHREDANNN